MLPLMQKFLKLKEILQTASDIEDPFNYFMTHFGENAPYMKSSQIVHNEPLYELMTAISKRHFQYTLTCDSCMFKESPQVPKLIHGLCQLEEKMIVLFYVEELAQGMISMIDMADPKRVNYYRFTTIATKKGPVSMVPGNPSVLH
ncbi:MAG: hypothetical protein H7839_00455 [Magnetococcus sp. YQC-5]